MRIAVLIIGLCLGFFMTLQTLLVASFMEEAAGGVLVLLFWLLGAALVIPFPKTATAFFSLAGVIAFLVGGSSRFEDMFVWGTIAFVLAIMSYFGSRQKRKKDAEDREVREALLSLNKQGGI